jgi:hypothetical protein
MKLNPNTMKLSDNTLTILKNFAGINNSILVKQGTKLRTISVAKNILAEAEIDEEFPRDVALYDLNQLLNILSTYPDPNLDFKEESYLAYREGNRRGKYFYSDPAVIISPPEKDITLPTQDVCFQLEHSVLSQVLKAAAVLQLPDLSVVGGAGVVKLVVRDKKNDTSHAEEFVVGETDKEFTFNFKIENIKIIPGAYDVVVSSKLLSKFTNAKYNLTYYIALEPDSTFG